MVSTNSLLIFLCLTILVSCQLVDSYRYTNRRQGRYQTYRQHQSSEAAEIEAEASNDYSNSESDENDPSTLDLDSDSDRHVPFQTLQPIGLPFQYGRRGGRALDLKKLAELQALMESSLGSGSSEENSNSRSDSDENDSEEEEVDNGLVSSFDFNGDQRDAQAVFGKECLRTVEKWRSCKRSTNSCPVKGSLIWCVGEKDTNEPKSVYECHIQCMAKKCRSKALERRSYGKEGSVIRYAGICSSDQPPTKQKPKTKPKQKKKGGKKLKSGGVLGGIFGDLGK